MYELLMKIAVLRLYLLVIVRDVLIAQTSPAVVAVGQVNSHVPEEVDIRQVE